MTVQDIYEAALRILAESSDPADNADYAERAPFIVAAFCTQNADLDKATRRMLGEGSQHDFNAAYIELDDEFPLLERFAPAASLYLASMLVMEDFEDLSDRLYDRYCDLVSRFCEAIGAENSPITDVYGFI